MVILSKAFGGLSNRLFQHIHLNSFCMEHHVLFSNFFVRYANTRTYSLMALAPFLSRKLLVFSGRAKMIHFETEDADHTLHERMMSDENLVFVEGWAYRNLRLTRLHRKFYRKMFYGEEPPLNAQRILTDTKRNIAVHVRRRDYKHWQGGKYYFSDSVYLNAIDQIVGLISGDYRILIFTDDSSIDSWTYLARYPDVYVSVHDERADHYLMSLCDYIVGPPSTFSMWASYIGNTKFCHIKGQGEIIQENSFTICDG
jgi:hypothetical protein